MSFESNYSKEELQKRIDSFTRWHYQFDLSGVKTMPDDKAVINRHQQRKRYFFDPFVQFVGGSLKGKRVLDMGCNAGFWSLAAIQTGADYVLGIDGRQMHIDQARFVFEVYGIHPDRYQFITEDLNKLKFRDLGEFDVVLCLGLLYHVNRHYEMFANIAECNTEYLIIDTRIMKWERSSFLVYTENVVEPRNSLQDEVVFIPSASAITTLTSVFGYQSVILNPKFTSYQGAFDYEKGERRAFICAKQAVDLSKFPNIEQELTYTTPSQRHSLQNQLQKIRLRLNDTQEQLQMTQTQLREAEDQLQKTQAQLHQQITFANRLNKKIQAIENTRSWKLVSAYWKAKRAILGDG